MQKSLTRLHMHTIVSGVSAQRHALKADGKDCPNSGVVDSRDLDRFSGFDKTALPHALLPDSFDLVVAYILIDTASKKLPSDPIR